MHLATERDIAVSERGIRDQSFNLTTDQRFLLFPTLFHVKQQLLRSEVIDQIEHPESTFEQREVGTTALCSVAKVTAVWQTYDPQVLDVLKEFHILNDLFLEARLRWKPDDALTVAHLQVKRCVMFVHHLVNDGIWLSVT